MNLRNLNINLSTFFSLKDKKLSIEKAYIEGIYSDTPANRKLGRVGMSYTEWDSKQGKKEEKIDNISLYRLGKVLNENKIHPMSVKDHKEYFLISLEDNDFKNKKKVEHTKDVLEKLGAKVYVSKTTHFLKAFKKDNAVQEDEEQDVFNIGDFKFDTNARTLTHKDGEVTKLTPKETALLKVFASNPNQFISRDGLLDKIWGESNYYNSRSMDVYITKLREKLAGDEDVRIVTAHWRGLKLTFPKDKSQTTTNEKNEAKDIASKEEEKKKEINKTILKKIDKYFGFEDEEGEWFADTPVALIMSNDGEFGEVIDKFTDYQTLSQSGSYKNDGSRPAMLGCNVKYEVVPKGTADEDVEDKKRVLAINNRTTIRDILTKLG